MTKEDFLSVLKYISLGCLFLILVVPLIVANGQSFPNLFFPYITGKNIVFRLLVEILSFSWITLAVFDPSYRPKKSWILWAIGIFIFAIGVSDIFGENPFKSFFSNFERMEGWFTLVHLGLYAVAASALLKTEKMWEAFFATSVGVSVFVGLQGLMQLFGENGGRLDSTLGNAAYFAVYMLFHIFITVFLLLRMWNTAPKKEKPWLRTFCLFAPILVLQIVMLYFTATRGPILGLLGGTFLVGILLGLTERKNKKLRLIAGSAIAVVIVIIGVFFLIRDSQFVRTSPVLNRFAAISISDPTTLSRFTIWNIAYQGFKERPVLGWGQENFNYSFNKYYDPAMYNQEQWFDRSHNVVLDWLVAGGIIGVLSYLSIFATVLWVLWRSNLLVREKSVFTGLLAAYFFQNLFVFDNITSYILFFTIIGYVQYRGTVAIKESETEWQPQIQIAVVTVSGIIFCAAMYFCVINPLNGAVTLIEALQPISTAQGQQLDKLNAFKKAIALNSPGTYEAREQLFASLHSVVSAKLPKEVVNEYVQYAYEQVQLQLKETPNDTRYFYLAGSFLQDMGVRAEAATYLERAHELSPRKQPITMLLASNYFLAGQKDRALALFKEAYEVYPKNDDAKKTYGLVALYSNDRDLYTKLFGTEPVMDERFLSVYKDTKQYDLMIAYLQKAAELKGNSFDTQVALGMGYWIAEKRPQAVATFNSALTLTTSTTTRNQIQGMIDSVNQGKMPTIPE